MSEPSNMPPTGSCSSCGSSSSMCACRDGESPDARPRRHWSPRDAAAKLGVSYDIMCRWIRSGKVKCERIGSYKNAPVIITNSEVLRLASDRAVAARTCAQAGPRGIIKRQKH